MSKTIFLQLPDWRDPIPLSFDDDVGLSEALRSEIYRLTGVPAHRQHIAFDPDEGDNVNYSVVYLGDGSDAPALLTFHLRALPHTGGIVWHRERNEHSLSFDDAMKQADEHFMVQPRSPLTREVFADKLPIEGLASCLTACKERIPSLASNGLSYPCLFENELYDLNLNLPPSYFLDGDDKKGDVQDPALSFQGVSALFNHLTQAMGIPYHAFASRDAFIDFINNKLSDNSGPVACWVYVSPSQRHGTAFYFGPQSEELRHCYLFDSVGLTLPAEPCGRRPEHREMDRMDAILDALNAQAIAPAIMPVNTVSPFQRDAYSCLMISLLFFMAMQKSAFVPLDDAGIVQCFGQRAVHTDPKSGEHTLQIGRGKYRVGLYGVADPAFLAACQEPLTLLLMLDAVVGCVDAREVARLQKNWHMQLLVPGSFDDCNAWAICAYEHLLSWFSIVQAGGDDAFPEYDKLVAERHILQESPFETKVKGCGALAEIPVKPMGHRLVSVPTHGSEEDVSDKDVPELQHNERVVLLCCFALLTLLAALLFFVGGLTFLELTTKLAFLVLLGACDIFSLSYHLWSSGTSFRQRVALVMGAVAGLVALSVSLAWLISGAPLWTMVLTATVTGVFSLVNMLYGGKRFLQLPEHKQWLSKAVVLGLLCVGLLVFTVATHGVGVLALPKVFALWLAWSPQNIYLGIASTVGAFLAMMVYAIRFYKSRDISKKAPVTAHRVDSTAGDIDDGSRAVRPRTHSHASDQSPYVTPRSGSPIDQNFYPQHGVDPAALRASLVDSLRPRSVSAASHASSGLFGTPPTGSLAGSRSDLTRWGSQASLANFGTPGQSGDEEDGDTPQSR